MPKANLCRVISALMTEHARALLPRLHQSENHISRGYYIR